MRTALIFVATAACLLVAPLAWANANPVATPGVIPPSSMPLGKTYGQWSAKQWRWVLEQPNVATSQVVNPNPGTPSQPERVDCTLDQSGKVWFLSGITFLQSYSAAYRRCTVPARVYLFFPVIDAWVDNLSCPGQPPGSLTAEQLADLVAEQTDAIVSGSMSVTVDGRQVRGLTDATTAYRAAAGGFTYSLPADSPIGPAFCGKPFPAGTSPPPPGAFADGVYIMLAPLPPGVHHIRFAAQALVSQNVTYTITSRR